MTRQYKSGKKLCRHAVLQALLCTFVLIKPSKFPGHCQSLSNTGINTHHAILKVFLLAFLLLCFLFFILQPKSQKTLQIARMLLFFLCLFVIFTAFFFFFFSLSEKHALNWFLFKNESAVKWNEQCLTDVIWNFKYKVYPRCRNVRRITRKIIFFQNALQSWLASIWFSYWSNLVCIFYYMACVNRWAGLKR